MGWSCLDFLIPALLAVDWENLPTDRDPDKIDPDTAAWGSSLWANKEDLIAYGFDDYDQAYDLCVADPDHAAQLLIEAYGTIYGTADDTADDSADDTSADDQTDILQWFDRNH